MHPLDNSWPARLAAARAGTAEALGELLEQARAYLLAIANAELGSELRPKAGASDLVQDSLLEAQRDFGHFAGDSPDELHGWLRRILRNNLANFTRHYRGTDKRQVEREQPVAGEGVQPFPSLAPTPSAEAIRREEETLLAHALEALPEHHRQVVVWRNREGRSFAEIGQLLGRSPDAARMLWGRAIEELRLLLEGRP